MLHRRSTITYEGYALRNDGVSRVADDTAIEQTLTTTCLLSYTGFVVLAVLRSSQPLSHCC